MPFPITFSFYPANFLIFYYRRRLVRGYRNPHCKRKNDKNRKSSDFPILRNFTAFLPGDERFERP